MCSLILSSSLQDEDNEIGLAVQQCISTSALAYRGIKDISNAIIVEALILDNIKRVSYSTYY